MHRPLAVVLCNFNILLTRIRSYSCALELDLLFILGIRIRILWGIRHWYSVVGSGSTILCVFLNFTFYLIDPIDRILTIIIIITEYVLERFWNWIALKDDCLCLYEDHSLIICFTKIHWFFILLLKLRRLTLNSKNFEIVRFLSS